METKPHQYTSNHHNTQELSKQRENMNSYYVKPAGTAAFLHALRNYRPSQGVRALVSMHPEAYRGSNFHDPNFLWTGLGK